MITLPVTAQMYHSLVQQQMPNNDNTVCVTPMQVQNFISSNNVCGSIANSNLNTTTTYIMPANNRNVINLPLQTASTLIKSPSILSHPAAIFTPKRQTIVKKVYMKKKVLNLAMAKPKHNSNQDESKKSKNNNSTNVKNRNQKLSSEQAEGVETSQSTANVRQVELVTVDSDETKVKEEVAVVESE